MTWLHRYRIRHYVGNSIWLLPVIGIASGLVIVRVLHWLESALNWDSVFQPEGARAVLGTLAASMFTLCFCFVCVAGSAATRQCAAFSSDYRIVFSNPVTKLSITTFMFTFTVTVATFGSH